MRTLRSLLTIPLYWGGALVGAIAAPIVMGFNAGFDAMWYLRERDITDGREEAVKRGWIKD